MLVFAELPYLGTSLFNLINFISILRDSSNNSFINKFPDGVFIPEITFILAQILVIDQETEKALRTFDIVIQKYPDSSYHEDSLYLAGTIRVDMGHDEAGKKDLDRLLKKYPNTTKALMEVLYRGQDWCADKSNWDEAKEIHAKRSEQPLDLVEEMWLDYWNPKQPNGHLDQDFVEDFRGQGIVQKRIVRRTNNTNIII